MNIEETIAARVARHAALADPARLRIVDQLTLGDAAPVELQAELGLSSSLLAHHLNLLERAGLLTRARSEADRRRTYLRLARDAFDGLLPATMLDVRRVVFVCTGNSARSQLATALWRDVSDIPGISAGTRPAAEVESGALAAARRHGLEIRAAHPQALDDVVAPDDFLVTVCDTAHESLGGRDQLHWSVPDPVRIGTNAAFDAALDELAERIQGLAPRLTAARH